ncbi:F-box/kelch-repeat protein At3g23880-like [Telopea speciosissima]|uniref:F-box/kelch-repeat protein At3g23880-like n=1 Tax=Telopea speciosissima TaxID=54955 RepID=UPI001CC76CC7|nr:F-box/kelch-repeat protein At3g23880-like [Telopea speciosissima]
MPNLPLDIIKEILLRLPVKSLLRFRCVSQDWRCLISGDSFFISMYHNRSIEKNPSSLILIDTKNNFYTVVDNSCHKLLFDEDDMPFFLTTSSCNIELGGNNNDYRRRNIKVVDSCNGLLCFTYSKGRISYSDLIYLLNPATRELKELPPHPNSYSSPFCEIFFNSFGSTRIGFGFDPMSKDYKVVKLVNCIEHGHVWVYSLNSDNWRKLGGDIPIQVPKQLFVHPKSRKTPVVNAAIHWMVSSGEIYLFDLVHEVFRELPPPPTPGKRRGYSKDILVMGGCLSVFFDCVLKENSTAYKIEIWMMKEYGVKESWTKQLIVFNSHPFDYYFPLVYGWECTPLEFWNDDDQILFEKSGGGNQLILYNTRTKTTKWNLGIRGLPHVFTAFTHAETLVMLNQGCREWPVTTEEKGTLA